jgi:hypothetical protein
MPVPIKIKLKGAVIISKAKTILYFSQALTYLPDY